MSDGDETQELYSKAPAEFQLRRKDDMKKAAFRQSTAQYSMANLTVVSGALLLKTTDIGENISTILTWIVLTHGAVIATVVGFKAWEIVAQIKGPK